jgi:hypothetical protein
LTSGVWQINNITLQGIWQTGSSHAVSGTINTARAFVVVVGAEDPSLSLNITGVTYGGQPLTQAVESRVGTSGSSVTEIWYLNEAGIQAAVGNSINVTSSSGPANLLLQHAFFSYVNQTTPVNTTTTNDDGESALNTLTGTLNGSVGGMSILGASSGNTATSFTETSGTGWALNGFQNATSSSLSTAYRLTVTSAPHSGTVTHNSSNRLNVVIVNLNKQ